VRPPLEELARRDTPMGTISLRRRVEPSRGVDVYEAKLGDEFLMSSLFTVAEIELARLGEVVKDLPKGVDTMLGENGVRLSGGQRQRVSIARSLYHNPDVLILDEATSALDNETEKEVSDAINRLSGDKTLIIIAHRLSTVRHCDKIVLLDNGKIVDSGTFEALAKRNADFRRMVELANLEPAHMLLATDS